MSRRHDLEELIRSSYKIIHDNEPIIQTAEPKEASRLKRENETQWELIEKYLTEYIPLTEHSSTPIPDDIREIAAHFPDMLAQTRSLNQNLKELVDLFLAESFERDQFIKLDQAGETDPERSTLLQRVFVDLEVKMREGPQPQAMKQGQISLPIQPPEIEEDLDISAEEKPSSAMLCFMQEIWPKIAVIGGPGQGKSTLGQHLAQVHRAKMLDRDWEFTPEVVRIPFRIVLKYFAQWLTEDQSLDTVDAYLAEAMHKLTSRSVSPTDIQEICRCHPCLIIFDGLDEVIDPELRSKMMTRLEGFLSRLEQLKANVQVLATSRPTGYRDHFAPEHFWHLELLPLSPKRVESFANKWVVAKKLGREEKKRVLQTLEECQQDEALSELLTTPLQVMIVLLIIKDGGRPPAQREALFNEYWKTIFRRERSKTKDIIRTDESELSSLHAYLGYLLHCRAAKENVQSLLPEAEFEQAVYDFLRRKDHISPDDVLKQKAAQMVAESRERLVLLVEPLPDLFGFEIRSLQEFFAAVHLFQTATGLEQRFERLEAIARSEHWRNVALFFAGRVARLTGGEASNILGLVCQPIDRVGVDQYLRRGAWLALDIAADGALRDNRNLQYNAVEYALKVLETGLVREQQNSLRTAINKLSSEDQRDILKPALEAQLRSLPVSCLEPALLLYGKCFGATSLFQERLEYLMRSGREDVIRSAFGLAFQYQAEPAWLAARLREHWPIWSKQLWGWWQHSPQHVEATLRIWSPSEEEINSLGCLCFSEVWYIYHRVSSRPDPLEIDTAANLESTLEQLLLNLRCVDILLAIRSALGKRGNELIHSEFGRIYLTGLPIDNDDNPVTNSGVPSAEAIIPILERSDLAPWLRVNLWLLVWQTSYEPDSALIARFLQDAQNLQQMESINKWIWIRLLTPQRPLLAYVTTRYLTDASGAVSGLLPHLYGTAPLSIARQVHKSVATFIESASEKESNQFLKAIRFGGDLPVGLSSLSPLADSLGLTIKDLVNLHIEVDYGFSYKGELGRFTVVEFQTLLNQLAQRIEQPNTDSQISYQVLGVSWPDDPDIDAQARKLLESALKFYPHTQDQFGAGVVIVLFLKLLAQDSSILKVAPRFFSMLRQALETGHELHWVIALGLTITSPPSARELITFLKDDDEAARLGAIAFWVTAIQASFGRYHFSTVGESRIEWVQEIRFDWEIGVSLLQTEQPIRRRQGITLLTFSNYPIVEAPRRQFLLDMIMNSRSDDEDRAWVQLLGNFPVQAAQEPHWCNLLESILAYPQHYPSKILSGAMERYQELAKSKDADLLEQNEVKLGLP